MKKLIVVLAALLSAGCSAGSLTVMHKDLGAPVTMSVDSCDMSADGLVTFDSEGITYEMRPTFAHFETDFWAGSPPEDVDPCMVYGYMLLCP